MTPDDAKGIGCAATMLTFNALAIGLWAISSMSGPFSIVGQEIWYRYGAFAFLLAGAIAPGFALAFGARRRRSFVIGLTLWMIVVLLCFYAYLMRSGGGV